MTDEEKAREFVRLGYSFPRRLPSGEWAGLMRYLFTVGLVVGLDAWTYRVRYCYAGAGEAFAALVAWDGTGTPPGPWIKEKGRTLAGVHVDRDNPATASGE